MIKWAHKELLFTHPILKKYYEQLKKQNLLGSPEKEFLRTLNLIHFVPLKEIILAIELVLQTYTKNNLFEESKSLLLIERRPDNIINLAEKHN